MGWDIGLSEKRDDSVGVGGNSLSSDTRGGGQGSITAAEGSSVSQKSESLVFDKVTSTNTNNVGIQGEDINNIIANLTGTSNISQRAQASEFSNLINSMQASAQTNIKNIAKYAGIGLGVLAIILGVVFVIRKKRKKA